jgi:hypothetical protein
MLVNIELLFLRVADIMARHPFSYTSAG